MFCNAACPVVCAATSFHEDTARRALYEEARKPNSTKTLPINDLPRRTGYGELEEVLCRINRESRRVHQWTPSGRALAVIAKLSLAHRCRSAIQEESISPLEGSVNGLYVRAAGAEEIVRLTGRIRAAPQLHR